MSDPSTAVNFGPVLQYLSPAIQTFVVTLAGGVATYAASLLAGFLHIKLDDARYAAAGRAMQAEVQKGVARGIDDLSKIDVDIHSPIVAKIAQDAINTIPKIAPQIGLTPDNDKAKNLALATIGAFQAEFKKAVASAPVIVEPQRLSGGGAGSPAIFNGPAK